MALKRRLKILDCGTEAKAMENTALKLAFASTDMKHVNQHFGSAESFVIYMLDREQSKLLEVAQFGDLKQDGNEDKLITKLSVLDGCIAVYSQAIGASAVRQLKILGIQPVKVAAGSEISQLLTSVQEDLRSGSASWLQRAIAAQKPSSPGRFDEMEAEGWDE
ncbi:Nitrogenase FeMo-cofactor carrier protein NifX [hydrothermal vent metagenome]|uniref:Nitrogenase FeMo-cofactor carrier protein NifX n=1 Tax=hydrothermal vent metagenome TaxID=652676 RepID=A0A3B1BUQ7_9ZZZZ